MKVLLVSANTERITMPTLPLGLGLVAAAARKAGYEVGFLDLESEPDSQSALRAAVEQGSPDVIGISVRNIDDQEMESPRFLLEPVKAVIAACRALSQAPVVLGGAGYSIFPDAALASLGADMGVCGEGEVVFPALLSRLQTGQDPSDLPGVHVAGRDHRTERAFAKKLDDLLFPRFHLVPGLAGWLPARLTTWREQRGRQAG
ncbi:MAG: cobalamin B12-binding domain-containing protein [candidate division NC10 bacterium]|nr:cobalamin B12-binding domain-containing protein [candidate division NC10 bacterium]